MTRRLANLQLSLRERGRIRLGTSTLNAKGKKIPRKLDRFLFSAPDEQTVQLAARLYGGTPEPWDGGGRDRWRVISEADDVPVVFPAAMAFSQSYEIWQGGFCTRRCDGVTCEEPSGKRWKESPCQCDPDERDCKITTNLSVILPELPGLGTWRLVSHGYYAATELAAAVELIESAISVGMRVPARLFVERREVRRLIDGKPEVRKFAVPVLDLDGLSVAELGNGAGMVAMGRQGALDGPQGAPDGRDGGSPPAVGRGGWRPVDQAALPPAPMVTVADQLAENNRPVKRRANAAPEIPRTGRAPRPASDVDGTTCDLCANPYGTDPLVRNPAPGSKFVHRACLDAPEGPGASQEQERGRGGKVWGDPPPA
jgi:hypothetical protein